MDGVFVPPNPFGTVYFCEVQFQPDELLYERMLSEISIYIYRHRNLFANWRAIAIYPSRSLEQSDRNVVIDMLASGRIVRVYQEAKADGRTEEGQSLVLKQLTRKLGNITPEVRSRVNSLTIDRLESLGEALLDFTSTADLEAWFGQN